MIYNILLPPIAFLATTYVVVKDLAFPSPLNDPPRGTNGIHEGLANENHCLMEVKLEQKDNDTDLIRVISLCTQYGSQHGKNEQEIKSERGQHQ